MVDRERAMLATQLFRRCASSLGEAGTTGRLVAAAQVDICAALGLLRTRLLVDIVGSTSLGDSDSIFMAGAGRS